MVRIVITTGLLTSNKTYSLLACDAAGVGWGVDRPRGEVRGGEVGSEVLHAFSTQIVAARLMADHHHFDHRGIVGERVRRRG